MTVRRNLREVELIWDTDGDSSYLLLFGDQTFSLGPAKSLCLSQKVPSLQEGTLYNYSITASYQRVNSSAYQNNTVTSKTHDAHPHTAVVLVVVVQYSTVQQPST